MQGPGVTCKLVVAAEDVTPAVPGARSFVHRLPRHDGVPAPDADVRQPWIQHKMEPTPDSGPVPDCLEVGFHRLRDDDHIRRREQLPSVRYFKAKLRKLPVGHAKVLAVSGVHRQAAPYPIWYLPKMQGVDRQPPLVFPIRLTYESYSPCQLSLLFLRSVNYGAPRGDGYRYDPN
jgi:hypothetical protein